MPIQRHQNKPLCINSNNSLQFCFLFWQVPLWLLPWLQQHWIREVCRLNNLWTELIICIYPCVSQSKLFFKHNDYIVCMFEKWKFNYIVDIGNMRAKKNNDLGSRHGIYFLEINLFCKESLLLNVDFNLKGNNLSYCTIFSILEYCATQCYGGEIWPLVRFHILLDNYSTDCCAVLCAKNGQILQMFFQ